jgi:UDP-N-acetylglucosamine 2-epimerase (non-hydrolysing)
MIDTRRQATKARRAEAWVPFGAPCRLCRGTLHRPSNVDDPDQLEEVWKALCAASSRLPVVFPVHPRTRARLQPHDRDTPSGLLLCDPQPYVSFLSLLTGARVVLTDSGGIQEETTILGVPCLTLRDSTERPITVTLGTNRVIGADFTTIVHELDQVLARPMPTRPSLPLWDGSAAEQIVAILDREVAMASFDVGPGLAARMV